MRLDGNVADECSEYWRKHPELHRRVEMTAFFGRHYDEAKRQQDWRRLLALARWARIFGMPVLERRAEQMAKVAIKKAVIR